ncbi:uncharacterized protein DFL_005722 [Arthrobotrys flagrans]|uniref:Uncharacterized protein n=1 Tax=Arthrobotrys flagrans TaxID=97331 RepID=A0A436ZY75_ARTFL|nr:hypothetical protein DFL_005722 [Arthrobotrys flagrans]
MADTQKTEEREGPPLGQEEGEKSPGNPQPEPTSPGREEGSLDTTQNRDSSDDNEESTPQPQALEENKENIGEKSGQGEQQPNDQSPTQSVKDQSEKSAATRGRSRSRPTRRLSTKPSKMSSNQKDDGNASTTAVSSPDKSQSFPTLYEDRDAANKGQLMKRNRRRNKRSGYESSAIEEMPLRERQKPPQQQMQMQQQPEAAKKSDAIKLRLDLNLEIEVELKARIHGDLTLSLLS